MSKIDDMSDATHYEQMTEDIPQEARHGDPVQQALEILKNPREDDATAAAVKVAAYTDEITEMHGYSLRCANEVSDDVERVLDVRFGKESDRNHVDRRTRVQMYKVQVGDETHQMGRVSFCEGDDMGFNTYPTDAAQEDIRRRIEDFESAHIPDKHRIVDVEDNDLAIDIPSFE